MRFDAHDFDAEKSGSEMWNKKTRALVLNCILQNGDFVLRVSASFKKNANSFAECEAEFPAGLMYEEFMEVDFAFLDSGTGGVPYMLDLKKKSPESSCVYLGDTEQFPYGEKSAEQVFECAERAVRKIVSLWNPNVLVIACNTISVGALSKLREQFPTLPIVGTVPAIKIAAQKTRNGKIGLLATSATVEHPYSKKLIEDFAKDCEVFMRGDGALVSFVERELFRSTHEQKIAAVTPAVDFFRQKNCDTIILGCTHFTHVANEIAEAAGKTVCVVDSRDGVANHALRILQENRGGQKQRSSQHDFQNIGQPGMAFFVTRLASESEKREYEILCKQYGIVFGGTV